jgi:hypothetical protein
MQAGSLTPDQTEIAGAKTAKHQARHNAAFLFGEFDDE